MVSFLCTLMDLFIYKEVPLNINPYNYLFNCNNNIITFQPISMCHNGIELE